jgi:PAS domain S-box-containing protein
MDPLAGASLDTRFRMLADAAPIGIFQVDTAGRCCYANPAFEQITHLSAAGAANGGWHQLLCPEDAAAVSASLEEKCAGGRGGSHRLAINADGQQRWIDVQVEPVRPGDPAAGYVGTLVDVTTIVLAEKAAEDARDHAVEASRLKSEFIANISHEIRTPLNGVLGLTQILSETALDPKQASYVATIRRAGDDLLRLLNDVLDLSKVEAGAMRAETVDFDPCHLVRGTALLFAPSATGRGVALDVTVAEDLVTSASGDPARIRQVLSNLISNAIKFTDSGAVTVNASQTLDGPDRILLRIAVTDTGIGIPADAHEAIFEPFAQADSSTTRRFGGSGLGLSISRRILGMLGGRLDVQSVPGVGSTFTMYVPLNSAAPPQAAVAAATTSAVADVPLRILIAEDNPVNQLVLQTMLSNLGHTVDLAENGADAVSLVEQAAPDVVLMDCQMPVMDGYAATAAIRALPGAAADTPIVALTASAMPSDRQRCLDAGMDEYLAKPVKQADLVATIARVLDPYGVEPFGTSCPPGRSPSRTAPIGDVWTPVCPPPRGNDAGFGVRGRASSSASPSP